MKIGIIGLGDIATKAYLPVITSMTIELILCSRTQERVEQIASLYRIKSYCYDYKQLLTYGVDAVFIHTATSSHYEIVKFFLTNHVHVYVDKPISDRLEETMELYEMAIEQGLVLMVGFNRRYCPRLIDLKNSGKPDLLIMQKNRYNHPSNIRTFIYDDFIHVIDTVLDLFQGQEKAFDYNGKIVANQLCHLSLILQGDGATAFASMNRQSGRTEERIDYMGHNFKGIVENLNELEWIKENKSETIHYDDWTPVLKTRGFYDIIEQFFKYLSSPEASHLELEKSLRTHEVCEYLVMELESSNQQIQK